MSDKRWTVDNTDPSRLPQFAAVCAVANGYLAASGKLCEDRARPHPLTIINGVYDELDVFSQIPASAHERPWLDERYFDTAGRSPAVANLPNPLAVRTFVDGRELTLDRCTVRDLHQTLYLDTGVYTYDLLLEDAAGRSTRLLGARFASLEHPHVLFMRHVVVPIDHTAPLRVWSGIDTDVHSNFTGEPLRRAWKPLALDAEHAVAIETRLPAREIDVRLAVAHAFGRYMPPRTVQAIEAHDSLGLECSFATRQDEPIVIDRFVVITSSEDRRHGVTAELEPELHTARSTGFFKALRAQRAAWRPLWERCDVQIDGDPDAQRGLRFAIHHLLASAPRFTHHLSVPVKLLTGDFYQGNTFYDTDLYIVPFYTFTQPQLARSCINFRCEGVHHGRNLAGRYGFKGAKLAWQAGPCGEECLGDWYWFTRTNIHINADACYALMQYVDATGDEAFLFERGADLLVECARFYASRATPDESGEHFDLHDVSGPDEAHCHSSTNFFTNTMAARTLRWAADTVDRVRAAAPTTAERLTTRLALAPGEPQQWRSVADRLRILYDPQTKRYEQCAGFFQLPPPPDDLLEERRDWFVPLYKYQALNQPDVLMALALLREEVNADVLRANWQYYRDKSLDFSSMSFVIHAIVAAELGDTRSAHRDLMISAAMDLDPDLTGRHDTHMGLHGTALGGAWMAAVFGIGGVLWSGGELRVAPRLPEHWTALRFTLALRGARVAVSIGREHVELRIDEPADVEIPVRVAGERSTLRPGEPRRIAYASG